MGRLADFVDSIEEKRERRMQQRLEPFYQGMEQILLKKEDTERKTKRHNWITQKFSDANIDVPESTADLNYEDIENNDYYEDLFNEKKGIRDRVDSFVNKGFSKKFFDEGDQEFLDRVEPEYGKITGTERVKMLKDGKPVILNRNINTGEYFNLKGDKADIADYTGLHKEGKTRKFKKDGFEITEEFSETTGWEFKAKNKLAGSGTDDEKLKKDYEGKLVEAGLYNEFIEKFPDADGEKLKELYTRANAVAEEEQKRGNKITKVAGLERIKRALEEVGDTTTKQLESDLAKKEKELSEVGFLGKKAELKKEIAILGYKLRDRKILDELFEGAEETVDEKKVPEIGDIDDGFEFLGGDPSKESSWKEVKK